MEKDTRRGGILVSRNTFGNEDCLNLSAIFWSSKAKGGPSNNVIRLLFDSSPLYGPKSRAYPLSADPPNRICLQ